MLPSTDLDWLKARLAFIAAIRAELVDVKRLLGERRAREAKYNPRWREQPRAPKGAADGGQWVDGGGSTPKTSGARPPPRQPPQARLVQLTQHERGRSRPWGGHTLERHAGKPTAICGNACLTVSLGLIFGQRFDFGRTTAG